MIARLLRSPCLSVSLFLLLVASVALHVARERPSRTVAVVASSSEGPPTRPVVRVDFDAPMTTPDRVGVALAVEQVSLEPGAAVDASFETPRRLRLVPRAPLAPFSTYRVRFGASLASLDGRPVRGGEPVVVRTGRFDLAKDPLTTVDVLGRAVVVVELTGPVAEGELAQRARVRDAAGAPLAVRWEGSGTAWNGVLASLPDGDVAFELAAGLRSTVGGEATEVALRRTLRFARDLRLVSAELDTGGDRPAVALTFSRALAPQDLRGLVTVDPAPADLEVRPDDGGVRIVGSFAVGATVAVVAKAGLRAEPGLRLEKDARRVLRVPEPEPSLSVVGDGGHLSTEAAPELVVEGVNVPEVEVSLVRVPEDNLVPLALGWRSAGRLAGEPARRRVAISAERNRRFSQRVDLAALFGADLRGAFEVEVSDPRTPWRSESVVVQRSDLGAVVRVREEGVVVWVARISDGAPVAGARVAARTKENRLVAEGRTDAQGLFVARDVALATAVVVVSTPTEVAWVDLRGHRVAPDARQVEGASPARGVEAWVRADRGVVRPGEVVHLDAIVRTAQGEAPPEGVPLVLTLRGPDRRVVRRLERRATPTGLLDVDLPLAADAPVGAWTLDVTAPGRDKPAGGTAFRVEAFVPDRIEATLSAGDKPWTLDGRGDVTVDVRLLTGEPAPGRTVRTETAWAPVLDDAPVAGYAFGDTVSPSGSFSTAPAESTTDAAGRATVSAQVPAAGRAAVAMRGVVSVEVVDLSGRAITRSVERVARPAGPRLGVRVTDGGAVEVVLVGAAGATGAAGAATATADVVVERRIVRGTWRRAHRGWTYESSEVADVVATTTVEVVEGRARWMLPAIGDGSFSVRVGAKACAPAAVRFWRHDGVVALGGLPDATASLALRSVAPTAQPGLPLALEADVPFAGRGLLTVEGAGTLLAQPVELVAGRQRLEVPLGDVRAPSLHATLTLVRGARGAEGDVRLLASAAVRVARPERALALDVEAPAQALPEGRVVVRVSTAEPADVRVHLVDQGVLARTLHADADPTAFFGAVRRLDTEAADAWTRLFEGARFSARDPEPGGDEGGSDGLSAARLGATDAAVIETVALASRRVAVDGHADVAFDLPAYEGRLRLVVVGATRRGTGAVARDLVVRGPIGLAVHGPRAVAPGDLFDVGVEARGDGVVTQVALDGLERVEDGPPLRVRALDRLGTATVTVTARDAAGHEAVRRARVLVRPASPWVVAHEVRTVAAGQTVDGPLPGDLAPSTRRARVVVGTGSPVVWGAALDRLRDYPYGCVEQTTSRAFPLLAMLEASRGDDADLGADLVAASAVDGAVDRLLSMQTSDGGLACWPGGVEPDPFGTAYGGHFLLEARRLGHAVPDDRLDALLDRVERRLSEGQGSPYDAHVLALAGRATGTWLEVLAERATTVEDRARLAAAFVRGGDLARAAELLETRDDPFATPRQRGGALASPLRSAALLLTALDDARPDDPRVGPLVARLTDALGRGATTPQEDATSLLALVHHDARVRGGAPAASGRLVAGGHETSFSGAGATLEVGPGDPWTWSLAAGGATTVVVRTEGVPRTPDLAAHEAGARVTRRVEDVSGPFARGRVHRVVLEGELPEGAAQVLVTDVLPGGLEVERADRRDGDLAPDRVEVRDDRVLFFRTAARGTRTFRQTYEVRAVTPGRYVWPGARVELLYDPAVSGASAGSTVEVSR
ncbi:MAG: hypothetical protein IT460_06240 [Planctomycetes bacterium]|nr:hypothetical protein [Planctomycetota bacterium]